MFEITSPKNLILQYDYVSWKGFFVFGHASEHVSLYECIRVPFGEVISLETSSKKDDVINYTYSDVPLLAKVNLFIRRSELTCSPSTYIIYLIGLVI